MFFVYMSMTALGLASVILLLLVMGLKKEVHRLSALSVTQKTESYSPVKVLSDQKLNISVKDLSRSVQNLEDRVSLVESRVESERSYERAIRMVSEGYGVDEISSRCGLSEAEARLVYSMHGNVKKVV